MKLLEYYLNLPYTLKVEYEGDSGFSGAVLELPGCIAQGRTEEETLNRLKEAQLIWLSQALENGIEIPEPSVLNEAIEAAIKLKKAEHSETNLEMLQILQKIKDGEITIDEALQSAAKIEADKLPTFGKPEFDKK